MIYITHYITQYDHIYHTMNYMTHYDLYNIRMCASGTRVTL